MQVNEEKNPSNVSSESPANRAGVASATPWRSYQVNGITYLRGEDSPRILVTVESLLDGIDNDACAQETQLNAALIVRAVNSHDALVDNLKAAISFLEDDSRSERRRAACLDSFRAALEAANA